MPKPEKYSSYNFTHNQSRISQCRALARVIRILYILSHSAFPSK
eukprot:UN04269